MNWEKPDPGEYWHEDWKALLEDVLKTQRPSPTVIRERGYLRGPERFRKYLSGDSKPHRQGGTHSEQAESSDFPHFPNSQV